MKVVNKVIAIGVLGLIATGCSTVKTNELVADESLALKDKSVVIYKYEKLPDFAAQTAANVQFGLLGAASAVSSGNKMINNNKIEDPAFFIARELSKGLSANHNVKVVEANNSAPIKSKVDNLIASYGNYDFILDVKTLGWNSIYFPTDWDNYRVMYSAHARLIDVKSRQVIAEEVCNHLPEYKDTNKAPSYKQLEDGVGLKEELGKSVAFCVEQIRSKTKIYHVESTDKVAVSD